MDQSERDTTTGRNPKALRFSTARRDTTRALQTNLRFEKEKREEEMYVIFVSFRLDLYRGSVHKTVCLAYQFNDKENFAT